MKSSLAALSWSLLIAVAGGCIPTPDPSLFESESSGSGGTTTEPASTTTGSPVPEPTTDGAADTTTLGAETTTSVDDTTTGAPPVCGALDLLLVLDNSGSMAQEQGRVLEAIDDLLGAIDDTAMFADLNIMVLDVDPWQYELCEATCDPGPCAGPDGTCDPFIAGCFQPCTIGRSCITSGFSCETLMPSECDQVLGAGVVRPYGTSSSNQDCAFSSGGRYIDATEPDVEAALSCAAQVGYDSFAVLERPMEAMVRAVSAGTTAEACNQGFLRDEAKLLVAFVTDEDDAVGDSAGDPAGWQQVLITAKGGDASSIVVLGIFGDNDDPNGICGGIDEEGAEAAPRLRQFVESFGEQGLVRSICELDYAPYFVDAVNAVAQTCR